MTDTTDLVRRLRETQDRMEEAAKFYELRPLGEKSLLAEAADAIERVIAERDEARATMNRWQSCGGCVGTFCKADALLERAERAEAERDALKKLLREARGWVAAYRYHNAQPYEMKSANKLLARIDAAAKEKP